MARKKNLIDESEIDEIINKFIEEELNGSVAKLSSYSVHKYNEKIANNEKFKRENGKLFRLYKYNIWAGSYNGQDSYGKKRITELKQTAALSILAEEVPSDVADIALIVNALHKNPAKLTNKLSKIFNSERKRKDLIEAKNKKLKEENDRLKLKIAKMTEAMANFVYQSQSPDNSLNNMLNITKSRDSVCYEEFKEMFAHENGKIKKSVSKILKFDEERNDVKVKPLKREQKMYRGIT
jgi:hypothetical protein